MATDVTPETPAETAKRLHIERLIGAKRTAEKKIHAALVECAAETGLLPTAVDVDVRSHRFIEGPTNRIFEKSPFGLKWPKPMKKPRHLAAPGLRFFLATEQRNFKTERQIWQQQTINPDG